MNKLKFLAFASVLTLLLTSCEKDNESRFTPDRERYLYNSDFIMSGAQVVPASSSTGFGTIEGTYDRIAKTYSYKITWNGLGSAIPSTNGIHIHGVADRGYAAIPSPGLAAYPGGIVQAISGYPTTATGTYSGSLYVDGTVVKEHDLLNGKFYVDIHTTGRPAGEIRGQIIFQYH